MWTSKNDPNFLPTKRKIKKSNKKTLQKEKKNITLLLAAQK